MAPKEKEIRNVDTTPNWDYIRSIADILKLGETAKMKGGA
jgi:hypothetical protein